ncbi:MAG: 2-oxoacid:acceptor oxidoreductase family protein [Thermodesulfobacteriota bacterium]|nr:2-oxoacid:acceptor oxidoreductase family protein [Thermodesulfobacteriota bacterium]
MTMKEERYEIRFSGSGGQGIVLAAMVLAEAAGIGDGNHVCQTQSYGPEARGGACQAEVVLSKKPIDYPRAMKLDLLLAMNQASCDNYFPDLRPEGLLVVDAGLVDQVPTSRAVAIPFSQIAEKQLGKKLVANMVALGAMAQLTEIVSPKALESAVMARAPKGTEEMNRRAFQAGIKAAQKVDLASLPPTVTPQEEEV